jgi:addiction module RelE/StbE family toxin
MKLSFTFEWLAIFEDLDPSVRKQMLSKLKEVARAASWQHEGLKGRQFKGLYKLRIGDYRLIYRLVDASVMDFLYLGHRREIYN